MKRRFCKTNGCVVWESLSTAHRRIPIAWSPMKGLPIAGSTFTGRPLRGRPRCRVTHCVVAHYEFAHYRVEHCRVNHLPITGSHIAGSTITGSPVAGLPITCWPMMGSPITGRNGRSRPHHHNYYRPAAAVAAPAPVCCCRYGSGLIHRGDDVHVDGGVDALLAYWMLAPPSQLAPSQSFVHSLLHRLLVVRMTVLRGVCCCVGVE